MKIKIKSLQDISDNYDYIIENFPKGKFKRKLLENKIKKCILAVLPKYNSITGKKLYIHISFVYNNKYDNYTGSLTSSVLKTINVSIGKNSLDLKTLSVTKNDCSVVSLIDFITTI